MSDLTHFNSRGEAHMVDVGDKNQTHRTAICEGRITMEPATLEKILQGDNKKAMSSVLLELPASWPPKKHLI